MVINSFEDSYDCCTGYFLHVKAARIMHVICESGCRRYCDLWMSLWLRPFNFVECYLINSSTRKIDLGVSWLETVEKDLRI